MTIIITPTQISTIIALLFIVRIVPLVLGIFISARNKNWSGMLICTLYICVTSANYIYKNQALNAIFSAPLVFLTAWYIIKKDPHNKRNKHIKILKVKE